MTDDDAAAIAEFVRRHGVTHCPTACAAPTQGSPSEVDRVAVERHSADRDLQRLERLRLNYRRGLGKPPWKREG